MYRITGERVCPMCGSTFVLDGNYRKYCSPKCRRAAEREASAERKRRTRKDEAKPRPPEPSPLSVIAREANEAGMTYGRYVSWKAACASSGNGKGKHTSAFGKRGTEC